VTQPLLISQSAFKDWLVGSGTPYPSTSDPLIARMLASISQFATSYLQRPIAPATFSEVYSGHDTSQLTLRQTPVILVRSLTVGTAVVPSRTQVGGYGFTNDSASVYVDGSGCMAWGPPFYKGVQNIAVTYDAGYQTSDTIAVPAAVGSSPPEIDATDLARPWNSDRGVAYATGVAFTLVTVTPTVSGTYQIIQDPAGNSEYQFAPADVGASIVITYGYTPEDVQQALIELMAERYKSRSRVGENSQNLGHGQVVSFSQKDMNAAIKTMLNPYRNVVPA
jgi:hypothetical protein